MEMEEARERKIIKSDKSCLASALIKMWGLGPLSARNVQYLASCGVFDGIQDERLQLLAALGTFGSHPKQLPQGSHEEYLQDYGFGRLCADSASFGHKS